MMKLAGCLLAELPAAAFQVMMKYLSHHAYATFRRVSRSCCQYAANKIPYISLRLSEDSPVAIVHQWHQATSRLNVTCIHIHLAGKVSAEVFDMAIDLLAQRTRKVTEIHLLGASDGSLTSHNFSEADSAYISTLQPISYVCADLQTLVIRGISVNNMAGDLQQLGASTPATSSFPHLKTLSLYLRQNSCGAFNWAQYCSALQHLSSAFPALKHLEIRVPALEFSTFAAADSALARGLQTACSKHSMHSAKVAVMATLASAAMQLRYLEELYFIEVPDIWHATVTRPSAVAALEDEFVFDDVSPTAGRLRSLMEATTAFSTLDACGCWLLQHHPGLRRLHISTEASTWGMSWHRHPDLDDSGNQWAGDGATAVATSAGPGWCIDTSTYETAAKRHYGRSAASSSAGGSMCLLTGFARHLSYYSAKPAAHLMQHITNCNLKFEHRAIDGLADVLSNLKTLQHLQMTMKGNRHRPIDSTAATATKAVIAAAATVHGLQSLIIEAPVTRMPLTADFLLPLTGSASSKSLAKLELIGVLVTASSGVEGITEAASGLCLEGSNTQRLSCRAQAVVTAPAGMPYPEGLPAAGAMQYNNLQKSACEPQCMTAAGASDSNCTQLPLSADSLHFQQPARPMRLLPLGYQWFDALRLLTSLQELVIYHQGAERLNIPVDCLPLSLKVFKGNGLFITPGLASSAVGITNSHCNTSITRRDTKLIDLPAVNFPCMHTLDLRCCCVSSPHILASNNLQRLIITGTLAGSNWTGGWAAAAAAWPALTHLTCGRKLNWTSTDTLQLRRYREEIRKDNLKAEVADEVICHLAKAEQRTHKALEEICVHFHSLRSLTMLDLPWLSIDVLQPAVHHMRNLSQIRLGLTSAIYNEFRKALPPGRAIYKGGMFTAQGTWGDLKRSNTACLPVGFTCKRERSYHYVMQEWLQQQLPCVSVCIAAD